MIKRDEAAGKERLLGWREVEPGGQVMSPGTSVNYKTGDWSPRTMNWNPETCTNCLLCWTTCPDNCMIVEDEQMKGIDTFYCKGCGLCENICPTKPKSLSFGDFSEEEE